MYLRAKIVIAEKNTAYMFQIGSTIKEILVFLNILLMFLCLTASLRGQIGTVMRIW